MSKISMNIFVTGTGVRSTTVNTVGGAMSEISNIISSNYYTMK